jgi:two-component system chemotaxis sensor kinase CheA
MSDDSDIVQDFLVESYENLDRLDRELVGLEKDPNDREVLGSVFRTIHTIKGTCGFLGFNKLEKVAHVGENLLTRLRDGQLTLNRELTTALLAWWMRSARCWAVSKQAERKESATTPS